MQTVEATVVEELPGLLYRLELENKAQVLAAGSLSAPVRIGLETGALDTVKASRNWVRLRPGDRVEIEFAERDPTRARIVRKI